MLTASRNRKAIRGFINVGILFCIKLPYVHEGRMIVTWVIRLDCKAAGTTCLFDTSVFGRSDSVKTRSVGITGLGQSLFYCNASSLRN